MTTSETPKQWFDGQDGDLWTKCEDVSMHFNELLIKLGTEALGAIATTVTAAEHITVARP